jgi:hypothetical protein
MTLKLLTTAIILALAAPAYADTATVVQDGTSNSAEITQADNGYASAGIYQGDWFGDSLNNDATITQTDNLGSVTAIINQEISDNFATVIQSGNEFAQSYVTQLGTGNSFNGEQSGNADTVLGVFQNGVGNIIINATQLNNSGAFASINQTGVDNSIVITQDTNAPSTNAYVYQTGEQNTATTTQMINQNVLAYTQQTGNLNSAIVSQAGNTESVAEIIQGGVYFDRDNSNAEVSLGSSDINNAWIFQIGSDYSDARIIQEGTLNAAFVMQNDGSSDLLARIHQNGASNSASIEQWGASHSANVTQTGTSNTAYVSQQ